MFTREKIYQFIRAFRGAKSAMLLLILSVSLCVAADESLTPKISIDDLVTHINTRRFSAAEAEKLRETIRGLPTNATQYPAGGDAGKISAELLEIARSQYLQNSGRPAAFNYIRLLLFLHDAPSALAVLEKIGPASDADAMWLIAMSDVNLQLGNADRAKIYLTRAMDLFGQDETLSITPPIAVTSSQGYRLYSPDTRVNFPSDREIILYVEISHAQLRAVNGEYRGDLAFALELRDDAGEVVDRNSEYGHYEPNFTGKVKEISATVYYRPPAKIANGKYVLRVGIFDAVSGQRAFSDFAFTLHHSGNGGNSDKILQTERRVDAEGFQKAIESNLWTSGDEQEDKTVRNLESMLRGMELRREQSKMQSQLLGQ